MVERGTAARRRSDRLRPGSPPLLLAGSLLGVSGLADVLAGHSMIGPSPYVTVLDGTLYHLDLSRWGWFHLFTGAASVVAGLLIVTAWRPALLLGAMVTLLSIAVDVMTIPYEPYRAAMGAGLGIGALRLIFRSRPGRRPG